ncbi:hypothetical protein ABK040_000675 [Willaertia magna]
MELLKISSITEQSSIDLTIMNNEQIKFIKYGNNHIVITTFTNNVYVYCEKDGNNYRNDFGNPIGLENIKETKSFYKINNFDFGRIKFLECEDYYTIIVNDLNEIYFSGVLDELISNCFIKIEDNNGLTKMMKKIRCGGSHLFILTNDNLLYGFGSNKNGELGLSEEIDVCDEFTKVNLSQVKDVQCGLAHSILLDFNGMVYTTGSNQFGELGLGNYKKGTTFTKLKLPFKVIKVFADLASSFILSENNELFGTGFNSQGQLGMGHNADCNVFKKVNIESHLNDIIVHKSFNLYGFISDSKNNIYFSGDTYVNNLNGKTTFKKLNFMRNIDRCYTYPLLLDSDIFILLSDYEINKTIHGSGLGSKLLNKVFNHHLIDLHIEFKDID